jgi:hypothetical protein
MEIDPDTPEPDPDEPRLILGVPGVGAGLLARSTVEWLVFGEVGMEATGVRREMLHWLDDPLPGAYFGVMSVHDEELAWFKSFIQRAGWTYGAPADLQQMQLAVARGD